jgi:hypothetical protein
MPLSTSNNSVQSEKPIWYFLLLWTVLNIFQAATLELHSDEAYYWIYSRFLDWGYFDHPPMVALFIRIGDSLMHNELGLRLVTVLSSTLAIYVLWLIVKKYTANAWWFILIVSATFIFHIYGFITTPDAPLLIFTVLFYYIYQQYIERNSWLLATLLALVIAALLYSKYHAVVLLIFTIASNIKLLKRGTFWFIVALAIGLYLPHILWQINHGYPSVNYHLFERSSQTYEFAHTYLFLPGQLLMAGPLIGWYLFYLAFTSRVKDAFIRCMLVNCIGTLAFFLLNTIKGNVQPHWTLIAFIPLAVLSLIQLTKMERIPRWFHRLAVINLALIVVLRVLLIIAPPFIRSINAFSKFYGFSEWAQQIKQKAGNAYVVMSAGFQEPSRYSYYTNSLKGFGYDTRGYRRTQFDIWPLEDSLQHKRVYLAAEPPFADIKQDTIQTNKGTWYGVWVNNARTYQRIRVETAAYKIVAKPGQQLSLKLKIINPGTHPVSFDNTGQEHPVAFEACFFQGDDMPYLQRSSNNFNRLQITAGGSVDYTFNIKAPAKKGRYDLIFSLRTTPFEGAKNNRTINFTVE